MLSPQSLRARDTAAGRVAVLSPRASPGGEGFRAAEVAMGLIVLARDPGRGEALRGLTFVVLQLVRWRDPSYGGYHPASLRCLTHPTAVSYLCQDTIRGSDRDAWKTGDAENVRFLWIDRSVPATNRDALQRFMRLIYGWKWRGLLPKMAASVKRLRGTAAEAFREVEVSPPFVETLGAVKTYLTRQQQGRPVPLSKWLSETKSETWHTLVEASLIKPVDVDNPRSRPSAMLTYAKALLKELEMQKLYKADLLEESPETSVVRTEWLKLYSECYDNARPDWNTFADSAAASHNCQTDAGSAGPQEAIQRQLFSTLLKTFKKFSSKGGIPKKAGRSEMHALCRALLKHFHSVDSDELIRRVEDLVVPDDDSVEGSETDPGHREPPVAKAGMVDILPPLSPSKTARKDLSDAVARTLGVESGTRLCCVQRLL